MNRTLFSDISLFKSIKKDFNDFTKLATQIWERESK